MYTCTYRYSLEATPFALFGGIFTDPELELFLKTNTFVIQASWETNKDIVAMYKIYYCCFLLW